MKPSKIIKLGLKGLLFEKKVWQIGVVYSVIILICLLMIAQKGQWSNRGIFDLIADIQGINGSTNQNMFMLVAIPFIVTVLTQLVDRNEQSLHVIKIGTRFHAWHVNVISAISLSLLLTLFILIISFLGGAWLVGTTNTWLSPSGTISKTLQNKGLFQSVIPHISTYKIVLTLFITKFLGFLTISFLTLFFKQFIRRGALIIMILIALAGVDIFVTLPFPIFTAAASLLLQNWLTPMITVYHCIYLAVASMVLYGVTGLLYERKDFLS